MRKRYVAALSLALAAGLLYEFVPPGTWRPAAAAEATVSFKAGVLPIFKEQCSTCHTPGGEGTTVSGLDLTTYDGIMKGTKYGPMIIPGNPDYSNLMWLLDWKSSPQLRMPHGKSQLPVAQRDTIRAWIRQGAKNN
jgi:mono/diheme cytochrome c family protein